MITGRNNGITGTIDQELNEESHYVINEDFSVDTIDEKVKNEEFDRLDNTILDFTESNPFGDDSGRNHNVRTTILSRNNQKNNCFIWNNI